MLGRVEVFELAECLVYVFDTVGFTTEDFVAMFNSRNLNLYATLLLLTGINLRIFLSCLRHRIHQLQTLTLPLQVHGNLDSLHLWKVTPVPNMYGTAIL